MAFLVGELFVPSFTRWCGFIVGAGSAGGIYRGLLCSRNPTQLEVKDADDGVTIFKLPPAAAPAGKPAPGTIVKVLQSPLAYIGLVPVATFPNTLPEPYVGQLYTYTNIGGFGVYAIVQGNDGTLYLALPDELSL